jgi:uncharacterized protein
MPADPPPLAPLRSKDRLATLDILRGLALLGIFIMNMPSFSHSLFTQPESGWVAALRQLFIAGKFNAMFALLFGIGFALQFRRLEASDPSRAGRIYLRRLLVLMALGLLHAACFWAGDVLFVYSLLGLGLWLLRGAGDRVLLALIAAGLLFPALAVFLRDWLLSPETEANAVLEYRALEASNDLAFGSGSFADAARENRRMLAWAYGSPLGLWSMAAFYVQMGTPLVFGYWVGRRGWVARLGELRSQLRRWQTAALTVGLSATLAFMAVGIDTQEPTWPSALLNLLQTLGRLGLMLFYALTLARLVQQPGWQRRLAPLAAAGRMPLTNYLLQTALATFIFHGWGLGQWGRADIATQIGLAVALFALVQVPASVAWLQQFEQGPLEALWRLMTYGRPAPRPGPGPAPPRPPR